MSPPSRINVVMFFFYDDWGKYGRSYEKTASSLAELPEVQQVICVFPPESITGGDMSMRLRERRISDKLHLLTECIPEPARKDGALRQMLDGLFGPRADRLLRSYFRDRGLTAKNSILWLFPPHPYIERILSITPHSLVVTQVLDNFAHFDKSHPLHGYAIDQYPTIGEWSDMIFTSSRANETEFSSLGVPCHFSPLAMDKRFIATPSDLPHKTRGARPRLGYLGYIMDRTDLALLSSVATKRTDWDLILVGPEWPQGYLQESGLLEMENVTWLGEMRNDEAPEFLASLDVCLIPHKDNAFSRSMAPLKLYQYLGSGRPVVSTPVAGLESLVGHLEIARNAEEFVTKIQASLENDTIARSAARIDAVRTETWDIRVKEMFMRITEALR